MIYSDRRPQIIVLRTSRSTITFRDQPSTKERADSHSNVHPCRKGVLLFDYAAAHDVICEKRHINIQPIVRISNQIVLLAKELCQWVPLSHMIVGLLCGSGPQVMLSLQRHMAALCCLPHILSLLYILELFSLHQHLVSVPTL